MFDEWIECLNWLNESEWFTSAAKSFEDECIPDNNNNNDNNNDNDIDNNNYYNDNNYSDNNNNIDNSNAYDSDSDNDNDNDSETHTCFLFPCRPKTCSDIGE